MPDTMDTIKCPACGETMTKLFLPEKGFNIDVCSNGCGGIYFDNQEIQEFSSADSDISEIKKLLAGKNFMPVDQSSVRICPACGIPMTKTNALGIQIDTCYKCGGIFLDNGEFELVRSKFKKRPKVQPIKLDPNSDINLSDFYRDAQQESYLEGMGYSVSKRARILGRKKYTIVDFIFDLIF